MITITGQVVDKSDGSPLVNYQVHVEFDSMLSDDQADDASTDAAILVSASARSNENGDFLFTVDPQGEPQDPVKLTISATDGRIAESRSTTLQALARRVVIRVDPVDPFQVAPSDLPGLGQRLRLTGRVIDISGAAVSAELPVVLWGRKNIDGGPPSEPTPLLITTTQAGGQFFGPWPDDVLTEAFGQVNGGEPVPISLDDQSRIVQEVLLVTTLPEDEDEVCECDQPTPRAPEQDDLVSNPEAFSQDLGGGCTDLSTPNRTLEEFNYSYVVRTSQPRVKALTINTNPIVPSHLLTDLLGASVSHMALRSERINTDVFDQAGLELDVDTALHLVRTNKPPSPESIARAAWLSNIHRTKDLIGSVLRNKPSRTPLNADAPIDWDETPTIHQSVEIAFGHLLNFKEVWRADGYSLGDLLYSLPLAPGQRRRVAVVDWDRRSSSGRSESLESEESLDAVIQRDRDIQEIVGTNLHETTRGGSRNTTYGAAGGIGAGFIGDGFGIFGGIAGGGGGSDSSSWQRSARRFSAESSQNLRDRVGQRASSLRRVRSTVVQAVAQGETLRAESEVVANYNRCHAVTMEYFEVLRHFLVTHEISEVNECVFVPLPMTLFNRAKALRWRSTLSRYLMKRQLRRAFGSIERVADNWVGWDYPISRFSEEEPHTIEGELRMSFALPRPRDAEDGEFQRDEWLPYSGLLPFLPQHVFNKLVDMASEATKDQQAARDDAFRREIAPQIAENLVNQLRFSLVGKDGGETRIPLDATLVSRYRENRSLYVSLRPAGNISSIPREDIAYFKIEYEGQPLPPDANVIIHRGKVRYRTDHMTALLFNESRILNDISVGDSVSIATPVSRRELRNPRQLDRRRSEELVDHLNEHLEFYHQAIWRNLDAQRRYMLLDAIRVPGQNGKSVASVCSNELIGIVGNSLVLPVSPGQQIDTTINRLDENGESIELINAYATAPTPPLRLSVPTRGVYAEAIIGNCNSCEEMDDNLYWRWANDKLLAPPEISGPISAATRATDEPDLTPTPLPSPLVNIQAAPDVPDPFGLAGAFSLLSKPELFRDITGLEGTQKNAIAAFDSALSAASSMGGEAAKLARQQELSKNADRMLDRISTAVDNDLLTEQQGRDLTQSVLEGMSGKAEPQSAAPTEDKTVKEALDKASKADKGKVKVTSAGETVEASFEGAQTVIGASGIVGFFEPGGSLATTNIAAMNEPNIRSGDLTPEKHETLAKLKAIINPGRYAQLVGLKVINELAPNYSLMRKLHITYPADPKDNNKVEGKGRLPIVVIAHGNHRSSNRAGALVENHKRYIYLQEALAKEGFVSVSVDMNICADVNSAVEMRAKLVIDAVNSLRKMDKKGSGNRLEKRLDFNNVVLVGHSRGGEAVCRAAVLNREEKIKSKRFKVRGVCSIAPMDLMGNHLNSFGNTTLESKHTPFYLVLYGALDCDVGGWGGARSLSGTGFRLYDRAKCDKSMIFIDKANHNRFNDVWMADKDSPAMQTDDSSQDPRDIAGRLLSQSTHRELAVEYITALCKWKQLSDAGERFLLNNSRRNKAGADVSVQWSFGKDINVLNALQSASPNNAVISAEFKKFFEVAKTAPLAGTLEKDTNQVNALLAVNPAPAVGPIPSAAEITLGTKKLRNWKPYDLLCLRVSAEMDVATAATISAAKLPQYSVSITDGNNNTETADSIAHPLFNTLHKPVAHIGFTPQIRILTSTAATAGKIKTSHPHRLATGDEVKVGGHAGSVPSINSVHKVTVLSADTFSIPVTITTDGAGGILSKAENLTALRMETVAVPLGALGALDLKDIRMISITPAIGFPTKMLFDSLQLVKV